jgi:hypothetical protein
MSATIGLSLVRRALVLVLAACLALSACGGDDGSKDSSSSQSDQNPGQLSVPSDTRPFTDFTVKERYDITKQVCYARGPSQVKLEFTQKGKTPEEIARAFSLRAPQNVRKAAYEGCLAGFKKSKRK